MRRIAWAVAALLAVLAGTANAAPSDAPAPNVLVSIKPVHSIVAAVMLGTTQPDVLLRGAASPHTYTLTNGDAERIAHADIVFWVGPTLENFLIPAVAQLPAHSRAVAFADVEGIKLLPARSGPAWENDGVPTAPGSSDPHIWLDPNNAMAIARATAHVLSEVDPVHTRLYTANAEAYVERLKLLDAHILAQLNAVRGRPFMVVHDAYQYFENHYGLAAVGSIQVASDTLPVARRMEELKTRIKSTGVACVFSGRPFSPQLSDALMGGTDARAASMEDLGGNIPAGPRLYQTVLTRIATTLESCLTR